VDWWEATAGSGGRVAVADPATGELVAQLTREQGKPTLEARPRWPSPPSSGPSTAVWTAHSPRAWCGADQVQQVGMVGPTVMTSAWICTACHSPFERVRSRGGPP
jgi:hypothetical protein